MKKRGKGKKEKREIVKLCFFLRDVLYIMVIHCQS